MRRFRFRLQSILDLRNKELDQRKLEFGAIAQRCARIEREIEERRDRRRAVLDARSFGTDAASTSLADWRAGEEFALRMQADVTRLRDELEVAERDREAASERYREARRNVDVLKRLRERREASYMEHAKRSEQKALDEISQRMTAVGRE